MDVLAGIVARKARAVRARERVLDAVAARVVPGGARDARGALRSGAPAVIAEVKRRSPSGGVFPHGDLVAVARAYEAAGAVMVSVLTDAEDFGGSLEDLAAVRAAVRVPVLRKDFLVDPREVAESVEAGADAVLLIAEALPGEALGGMLEAARRWGVMALVEAHSGAEAERALACGAAVVGVNNRDLKTLVTDLGTALGVLPGLRGRADVRVAESGLRTAEDLRAMVAAGADAVLVGEVLLRAEDPGAALRRLRGVE